MRKITVTLAFIINVIVVNGQELRKLGIDSPWYFGFIETNEHVKYMGQVKYNTKSASIHFKSTADSAVAKVFTEDRILSMEYYDTVANKDRKFYSLEYIDQSNNSGGYMLFEILKEFENFAFVWREAPIFIEQSQRGATSQSKTVVSQFEWFFFVNTVGIFKVVFSQRQREIGGIIATSSSNRNWIRKEVLEEYTGKHWPQLEAYIKSHELKLKRKEDLLNVMDYYETLLTN